MTMRISMFDFDFSFLAFGYIGKILLIFEKSNNKA